MKRKIAVFTGSRAEYGILKPVLKAIKEEERLELHIIAIGMHLLKEFGYTYKDIEKDGFKIKEKIKCAAKKDNYIEEAKGIGKSTIGAVKVLSKIKPDITLVSCDRSEMLGVAIAAHYLNIPLAHIHGGDKSKTKDESARHAITKLSHIHFPASKKSAERIKKLGEKEEHIFVVGAPGLDTIYNQKLLSKEELQKKIKIDLNKPTLLVVQHPTDLEEAKNYIKQTLEAIKELRIQTIIVYPNIDAGGRKMIKTIKEYKKLSFIKTFKSLPHLTYLSILKNVSAIIGNSSSAIIEAPLFKIPVVNIGEREEGRERVAQTIDVNHEKQEIVEAIKKALTPRFKESLKGIENPYGNGTAGKQIAEILSKIELGNKLLQKQITY